MDALTSDQWLSLFLSVGVIVITIIVGRWIINFIMKKVITRLTKSTKTRLDDLILEAIRVPAYWFLVILVADAMINRLDFIPEDWAPFLTDLFFVLYFVTGFVLIWRTVSRLFEWFTDDMAGKAEDPKLVRGLVGFFDNLVLVALAIMGLIILLSHFGVDPAGLIATFGVGSLAVALAAQSAFEDAISGFFIMMDQPFRVGDRIEVLDLNTWGDVADIGLRSSRIRTRDNRMIIVPNSAIAKSLIVNHSYPDSKYRIQVEIGIGYGSDIEQARRIMIEAVQSVEGVLEDERTEALFLAFGASALTFRVRWWIDSYVDTRRMFDKVNTALYNALNDANIDIPFPQQDTRLILDDKDREALHTLLKK